MATPDELDQIRSLINSERVDRAKYEELMKEAGGIITQVIFDELSKGLDESVLFSPNEDNRQFISEDGEPTDLLYRIVSKAAEDTLTFVRKKIAKHNELEDRLRNDGIFLETLKWGLIKNIQALISRSKTELLLVKGGECSLMEGFINCNSKFGRERFGQVAEEVFESMESTGLPASMMFIDLDNFKQVNDQFGHDAGDEALKRTADLITRALRIKRVDEDDQEVKGTDTTARLGGEEEGVIMEKTSAHQAVIPANRIREYLEKNPLLLRQHIEVGSGEKKSRSAYITLDRFESLLKKNGIDEIEIGDNIKVQEGIAEKLKGKEWKSKSGGRGMKITLPDQRSPDSRIVLLYIPITASIGIAEYSAEMMAEAQSRISYAGSAENIADLKKILEEIDVTESSPYFIEEDRAFFRALASSFTYSDLKAKLNMGGFDDTSFRKQTQRYMRGIIIRRSFADLKNQADEKMYEAKKAGRNCIAVGEYIVKGSEEVANVRELAMDEKGRKSFPSPPPVSG